MAAKMKQQRRQLSTPEACKHFLAEHLRAGNWTPLFRNWLATLTLDETALLSSLLNAGKIKADDEGWIPASPSYIQRGVGLDEEAQDAALAALERDGIVEVDESQHIRLFRVNLHRLERLLGGD